MSVSTWPDTIEFINACKRDHPSISYTAYALRVTGGAVANSC